MATPSTKIERAGASPPEALGFTAAQAGALVARTTAVDAVGLEERAASLGKRSIKRDAKLWALDLAIRSIDLTTLEGQDTPGKIVAMCAKAVRPDPTDPSIPSVAAVCLYPELVSVAAGQLKGTGVHVASVAGAFPSGLAPLKERLAEIRDAVAMGADEIDIVLNRSAFLSGRYRQAFEEIAASKEASGRAHLKTILEVAELGSYDQIRRASVLAMAAGSDFIKTSTGKLATGATLPAALCMMEAARDFHHETGRRVGVKVAGGVRQAKQAVQYLVLLYETLGSDWMTPDLFRIGASTLLNDVLMQIQKERTGAYQGPDYFTID
ncbi:MAG TPA: deoxyribose-phosphate aldolase [Actinomycetota bacterium]|jgi:deoxyribose-phosphate aldolase|nr:deoxyribose-phosphate aldolase [Actinomycetota bacterium]